MEQNNNNELDFRRFIRAARKAWWLYAAAFIALMSAALFYCNYRMPQYHAYSIMMIEDSQQDNGVKGGALSLMRTFSIGGFGSSSVDNEMILVESRDIFMKTVQELNLNFQYIEHDGMTRTMLYPDAPITVSANDHILDTLATGFTLDVRIKNGKADITAKRGRFFSKKLGEVKGATLPCTISTTVGDFTITPNEPIDQQKETRISVSVNGTEAMAYGLRELVKCGLPDKKADAIYLSLMYPNRQLGIAILNSLMEQYNAKRLARKQQTAREELEYYNDQLDKLITELSTIETQIEEYKSKHNLIAVEKEAAILMGGSVELKQEIAKVQASIQYYSQVLDVTKGNTDADALIPVPEGMENPAIEEYNSAVLKKKQLEISATPQNSTIKLINDQLAGLRTAIHRSVEQLYKEAQIQLEALQRLENSSASRLSEMPRYEREYLSLKRDQTLKSELYLFLLQKKGSAELKMNSNSTLGFIIDEAYTAPKPVQTKSMIAIAVALLLSIIGPTILIMLWMRRYDRIEDPMDLKASGLEANSIVYSGEQPQLSEIRTMLTEDGSVRDVYVSEWDKESTGMLDKIVASIRRIDLPVSTVAIDSDSNDAILSRKLKDKLQSYGEQDTVFVTLPDGRDFSSIKSIINQPESRLLILLRSGLTTRKQFKEHIQSIDPSHIIVVILK